MNKERVLLLADTIESRAIPNLGFNMSYFLTDTTPWLYVADRSGHDCGTVGCIAGWCHRLMEDRGEAQTYDRSMLSAQQWLDLTNEQMADLFYAYTWLDASITRELDQLTPDHAVATLRRLAETGEVQW